LWLRREVLPSIATRPSLSGQQAATQDEKQALNRSGSSRFITERNPPTQAIPSENSEKPPRNAKFALPQSTISS
jgi:hypothetical protein